MTTVQRDVLAAATLRRAAASPPGLARSWRSCCPSSTAASRSAAPAPPRWPASRRRSPASRARAAGAAGVASTARAWSCTDARLRLRRLGSSSTRSARRSCCWSGWACVVVALADRPPDPSTASPCWSAARLARGRAGAGRAHPRLRPGRPLLVATDVAARRGRRDLARRPRRAGADAPGAGRPARCSRPSTLARFSTLAAGLLLRGRRRRRLPRLADPRVLGRPSSRRRTAGCCWPRSPSRWSWRRSAAGTAAAPAPRSAAAAGFGDRGARRRRRDPHRAAEALLLVALLGVTGFLVNQSPRPAPVDVPAGTHRRRGGDGRRPRACSPCMHPARTGRTPCWSRCRTPPGEPVTPARSPRSSLRSGDLDLGDGAAGRQRRRHLPRRGRAAAGRDLGGAGQPPVSRFESPVTT